MKKSLAAVSLALALTAAISVPVFAVSIITGESFSSSSKNNWETDFYEPEEFDFSDNQLYLSVGKKGFTKYRPDNKKDKKYALQGRKLEVVTPSSNTWTATVKLNVDETWFSSSSNRKRAEFRVDLVDGSGNPIETAPTLALIKGGSDAPVFRFLNPAIKSGWGTGDKFLNGDKENEDFFVEEGWHTLFIKSTKGVLTYYVDEKKLGNCTISEKDVYPSYMAINMTNYERSDVTNWDNCYLYDGSYGMTQRSSSLSSEREDKLASQYSSKRDRWVERYTRYYDKNDRKWLTKSQYESKYNSVDGASTSLSKEIPDSYWDY